MTNEEMEARIALLEKALAYAMSELPVKVSNRVSETGWMSAGKGAPIAPPADIAAVLLTAQRR